VQEVGTPKRVHGRKGLTLTKKFQRTNKSNPNSGIPMQVVGRKRGAEVDDMSIDEVIPSGGKRSKGNEEQGGGAIAVAANDAGESMEGKSGEMVVRESAKNSIAGLSEQAYRSQ
jgi:hypothetical protein